VPPRSPRSVVRSPRSRRSCRSRCWFGRSYVWPPVLEYPCSVRASLRGNPSAPPPFSPASDGALPPLLSAPPPAATSVSLLPAPRSAELVSLSAARSTPPAASSRYGLSPASAPDLLDGRRPRPRRGGRRLSLMQLFW